MKTSSFFIYHGPGRISIARYAPYRAPCGFRIHDVLAPTGDMLKLPTALYLPRYAAILAALDPQEQWDILHVKAGGHEPVLLCWERAPFSASNWCHRRLVAEWFETNLGVEVPEYVATPELPAWA